MYGGAGNDSFVVDNVRDKVFELGAGGIDMIYSSINISLPANVEKLVLTGTLGVASWPTAWTTGSPAISANMLNGGAGADRLMGGNGNDTYLVDNSRDVVVETASGIDKVRARRYHAFGPCRGLQLVGHAARASATRSPTRSTATATPTRSTGWPATTASSQATATTWFAAADGRDIMTGGNGRDIFDFNSVAPRPDTDVRRPT